MSLEIVEKSSLRLERLNKSRGAMAFMRKISILLAGDIELRIQAYKLLREYQTELGLDES